MTLRPVSDMSQILAAKVNPTRDVPPSQNGIDFDDLARRLKSAIDFRTLYGTVMQEPKGVDAEQQVSTAASAVREIAEAIKVLNPSNGGDTAMMKLVELLERNSVGAMKDEIRELKEVLSRPSEPDEVDKLKGLAETLVILRGDRESAKPDGNYTDMISGLITLADRLSPRSTVPQPTFMDQLLGMSNAVKALREIFAPPQTNGSQGTVLRLGDGDIRLDDFLQIEKFRWDKEKDQEERQFKRERTKMAQNLIESLAGGISEAAEKLTEGDSGRSDRAALPVKSQEHAPPRLFLVNCDNCNAPNQVPFKSEKFVCASCGTDNVIEGW